MFSVTVRLGQRLSSWKTMPMPLPAGVEHVVEGDFLAAHQDAAGGLLVDTGEDAHQRRLAGTILADQHVDRTLVDLEVDILQRDGAREDAGHLLGAENDRRASDRSSALIGCLRPA